MKKLIVLYFLLVVTKGYSQCSGTLTASYTVPTCSTCCNGVVTASIIGTVCGPVSCPTLQPLGITSCMGSWNNLCPGNYTVVIIDGGGSGCCGNLVCTVVLTSGATAVKEFSLENYINIYPNPVSDILYFDSEKYFEEGTKVEITNTLGQIVLKTNFRNEIDVSSLTDGTYTLRFISKNQIAIKRLVVAR